MRSATAFRLEPAIIDGCLRAGDTTDRLFERAWHESLASIARPERGGALAGVTGHVAESVVEVMLDGWGYSMLWHFPGPGRHGVDLIALDPSGSRVVAIEVKGTLRPKHWPRLSRNALAQMSSSWIDKADNPGMHNWDFTSEDVYGAVVLVNFADRLYRAAFTTDFETLRPAASTDQLLDLQWLDEPRLSARRR